MSAPLHRHLCTRCHAANPQQRTETSCSECDQLSDHMAALLRAIDGRRGTDRLVVERTVGAHA